MISHKLQPSEGQLFVMDAEWGVGMRLEEVEDLPKNRELGSIEDMHVLEAHGREIARQCRERGLQSALAPVVDLYQEGSFVGERCFGPDPKDVARRGLAVMRGLQEGGLWACAKHFPGHGSTKMDSHLDLPTIEKSVADLRREDWVPFKALIEGGVEMVMVGHLLVPELDGLPSSLSPVVMNEILRGELGFEGIIITDSLSMGALEGLFSPDEIAERALLAGADLLLYNGCERDWLEEWIPKAIKRIEENVPESVIDDRLQRIQFVLWKNS